MATKVKAVCPPKIIRGSYVNEKYFIKKQFEK